MVFANINLAMGQNYNRYVKLTGVQGEDLRIDLKATSENTQIAIKSGANGYAMVYTIGRDWTGFRNYYSGSDTLFFYGDISGFDCSGNGNKITGLYASENGALSSLYCYDNTALENYLLQ